MKKKRTKPLAHGDMHVGHRRKNNEDRIYMDHRRRIYAVADGMGGHDKGEVCAEKALEFFEKNFEKKSRDPHKVQEEMVDAINQSHIDLKEYSKGKPELANMGSTLTAFCKVGRHGVWAHVGDSRIYHLLGNKGFLATVDQGSGNILFNCMHHKEVRGFRENISSGLFHMFNDCVIVLCSDGLSDMVEDSKIELRMKQMRKKGAEWGVDSLIKDALDGGGRDNIAVIAFNNRNR